MVFWWVFSGITAYEFQTIKNHVKVWANSNKSTDGQFGINVGKRPPIINVNSLDLHPSQKRPLAKVKRACPAQSSPGRRSWLFTISSHLVTTSFSTAF